MSQPYLPKSKLSASEEWRRLRYRLRDIHGVTLLPPEDVSDQNIEDFMAVVEEFQEALTALAIKTKKELIRGKKESTE